MSTQLEHLKLKKEQIEERIQDIKSREKQKKRKEETRAKILLGAMVLKILRAQGLWHFFEISDIFEIMHNSRDKEFLREWINCNFPQTKNKL